MKQVANTKGDFLLKLIFNHGGSHGLVKRSALPKDAEIFALDDASGFDIIAGTLVACGYTYLKNIILPEFSFSCQVKSIKAFIFDDNKVQYDCICGCSLPNPCKIDDCSSDLTWKWYGLTIPFHKPHFSRQAPHP